MRTVNLNPHIRHICFGEVCRLHVQPYWQDTLVLIVPPHHRLATQPAVTLADLAGETWIFREAGSASGQVVKDVLNGGTP
jgi:LysR family transcriptional regulator, transcriptional activator of the cysJI operon